MKTTFIELENEELHLRSGLSIMLQILNLSMRSKKTGIPPFLPSEILPSPYSLQKILRPPPRKRILSPPFPVVYIVIHSGTKDVGKLTANEIRTNMENCLVNLKHRWPNSTIAISGLTYVPRDNSKNQLIDEINRHYESICTDLGVTFIDNKRVTCDNYGNLIEQVFYDDVHLNNKIGTKKLVTNRKHHLGLRDRNLESLPGNRRGFARVPVGPQREQPYNERRRSIYHNNQPLQALNLIAKYLRESEMLMR